MAAMTSNARTIMLATAARLRISRRKASSHRLRPLSAAA